MSGKVTAARFMLLLLLATSGARVASGFTLVSRQDVAAERRFEATSRNDSSAASRSLPPLPDQTLPFIKIVAPNPDSAAIASPVRIELGFETSPDAHVVADSLRVLYGLLKIDITAKIRPYAKITDHGLVADNAALPTGNHRLFVQVSDSAGRTAVREISFTVVAR